MSDERPADEHTTAPANDRHVGFAQLAVGVTRVSAPAEMRPHRCNALCVDGAHALLLFTDIPDELSVSDVQATADLMRTAIGRRPVTIVAVQRAPEAPAPAARPYAWVSWVKFAPKEEGPDVS